MPKKTKIIPSDIYERIIEYIPVVAVDVIFLNQDRTKTLLFKRNNEPAKDVYYTIGGRLFKNENLFACALRQIERESGLKADPTRLKFGGVQDEMWHNSMFGNIPQHFVIVFFSYVLGDEKIVLDLQHSDYQWFSIKDEKLHPLIKSKLEGVLKINTQPR